MTVSDEPMVEGDFGVFASQLVTYVEASARQHGRALAPTSRMAREIVEHPGLPMREAWVHPSMILTAADDHLRALAAAIEAPNVALSIMTIGRLATELSSLAYWLLEPTLTPRKRAARFFAHRLDDAGRQASAVTRNSELFGDTASRWASKELNDVHRQIEAAGLTVGKGGRSKSVDGERLPEPTERAGIALGEDAALGEILCEQASGLVHGRETAIRSFAVPSGQPSTQEGVAHATLQIDAQRIALAVSAACLPHHQALGFLMDARGQLIEPSWEDSFQRMYWTTMRPFLTSTPVDGTRGGRLPAR